MTLKVDGNSCTVTPVKNGAATVTASAGGAKAVCAVTSRLSIDNLLFIAKAEKGASSADNKPVSIGWEKNEDGTVPLTEANLEKMRAVKGLNFSFSSSEEIPAAMDLSDLQWFTGLENMLTVGFAAGTPVEVTLPDFRNFPNLVRASIFGCSFRDLDLSGNTGLLSLTLENNPTLASLILSAEMLYAGVSRTSLTALNVSECSDLMYLMCDGNRLSELDITGCPDLVILECGGQTSDGTTAQTLTLILTDQQKTLWDSTWSNDNEEGVEVKVK